MPYKRTFLSLVLGITLILALALAAAAQTATPAVSVSDQAAADGMVMIDEVVAAQDGWLVIHAQKDGGIGPVIGYAAVTAGSNTYLTVEIDPMAATETLYAMLHIDEGVKGTYEFPGADGPALVDGKPVTPPFMLTNYADVMAMHSMEMMAASVTVADQDAADGMVTIGEVVAAQDGWLVIHAQKDGGIGPVIGHTAVMAGANADVMVEIDPMAATETLYAMLHIDEGVKGTYEFPGADGPALVDGKPVTPPFMLTNYADVMAMHSMEMMAASVTVADQDAADGMVTIGEVVAAQDGWLVIHAQKDGGIGPVIGHTAVMAGANADVMVEIDPMAATETLYAMLHIDEGVKGTYEFPGADGPALVDGKPVTPPFMLTNYADVMAMHSMEQAAAPEMLPVTGGVIAEESPASSLWMLPLILLVAVLAVAGLYTRQSRKHNG